MNPLREKKLRRVFASFDSDQDGVISRADLLAIATTWCQVYELSRESSDGQLLHEQAHQWWDGIAQLLARAPLDSLSVDQWLEAAELPRFSWFVDEAAIPFSMAVFRIADEDGDGQITAAQMMAAQSKTGMRAEDTERVFSLLDADGDGLVTAEDYVRASREFYFSEDPHAAGNFIAGPLV